MDATEIRNALRVAARILAKSEATHPADVGSGTRAGSPWPDCCRMFSWLGQAGILALLVVAIGFWTARFVPESLFRKCPVGKKHAAKSGVVRLAPTVAIFDSAVKYQRRFLKLGNPSMGRVVQYAAFKTGEMGMLTLPGNQRTVPLVNSALGIVRHGRQVWRLWHSCHYDQSRAQPVYECRASTGVFYRKHQTYKFDWIGWFKFSEFQSFDIYPRTFRGYQSFGIIQGRFCRVASGIGGSLGHDKQSDRDENIRDGEEEQSPFGSIWGLPPMAIGLLLYYGGCVFAFWSWNLFDDDHYRRARLWGSLTLGMSAFFMGVGGSLALFGVWW